MNVLDFEEDGPSWLELVPPPLGGEDGCRSRKLRLPPDKASAILRRELVAFELVPSPLGAKMGRQPRNLDFHRTKPSTFCCPIFVSRHEL
jgi:hypothetical protein